MPTKGWVDKQNELYLYHGPLFSLKKKKEEKNSDVCCFMVELWRYCTNWDKSVPEEQILNDARDVR